MRKIKDTNDDSPYAEEEPVCAGHALGFPLRNTLGFSPIESVTIDIFRCLCDVYATASAQPWEAAIRLAEDHVGAADGPVLVARVTALLRALRQERGGSFSYLSTGCQHISPDELTVATLVKALRIKDTLAFERCIALALKNNQSTERTRAAARHLAEMQNQQLALEPETDARSEFEHQTVQALYLH